MKDFFVDFDGIQKKVEAEEMHEVEMEDAVRILKLLKGLNIKGL